MEPDIIINGQTLELHGQVIAIADSTEVKVAGDLAGYAFVDRTNQDKRFVLYANDSKVHIWKDGIGDIFTLDTLNSSGLLLVNFINTGQVTTGNIDINGAGASVTFRDQTEPVQSTYYTLSVRDGKLNFSKKQKGDLFTVTDGEMEMKGQLSSYAFHDRNNPSNRFVLYAVDDTIRIWKEGTGDILSIGNKSLEAESIVGTKNEVDTKGELAGYAFHDRHNEKNRYVLYADQNRVHIWKDGIDNILTIEDKTLYVDNIIANNINIRYKTDTALGPTLQTMDLLKIIQQLQDRVAELEKKVSNFK